jgi:hypothetical protein
MFIKAAIEFCRPESPEISILVSDTATWLKEYLLSIHPDQEGELAAHKETLGLPDPRDCEAAKEYGAFLVLDKWETTGERETLVASIDEYKKILLGLQDTAAADWVMTDWMRCVD